MIGIAVLYAALVVGVMLWVGWTGWRFKGTLKPFPLPEHPPSVSIIVPARDEERNLPRCIHGLVRQDYRPDHLELIFVDDASRDATPRLLAEAAQGDSRIQLLHTGGKPANWNGKQWACHLGAQAAISEWLCFMDADTYAEPALIGRAVAFALANQIDMLTLQPWFEMRSLWERIVMPMLLTPFLAIFPPGRVNDPHDRMAIANGQFILIRRSVYETVRGHAAIKDRLMDDFPLAEIVKAKGYRLYMADGADVLRVRMYRSLPEIRAGALKAAVDITGGWARSVAVLVVYWLVGVLPGWLWIGALLAGDRQMTAIMGGLLLFQMAFHAGLRVIAYRLPPWSGVTCWWGTLISLVILTESMIRVASGREIRWKDRPVMRSYGMIDEPGDVIGH